jgi:hypothetical protein
MHARCGKTPAVARVLICEPHGDTSDLLELVVRRLGHEPVRYSDGETADAFDAAVIEPGEERGYDLARRLSELGVPLLFTSIYPASAASTALRPAAYLLKPFPLYALERALGAALAGAAPVESS